MPKTLPVHVDRFAQALAAEGLDLPRHQVGRLLAAALGHREFNSLKAAADRGDLDPPEAGDRGLAALADGTFLHVAWDPVADLPYGVAPASLSRTDRRKAFGITPYGNLVGMAGVGDVPAPVEGSRDAAASREASEAVLRDLAFAALARGTTRVMLEVDERVTVRFDDVVDPYRSPGTEEAFAAMDLARELVGNPSTDPTGPFDDAWNGTFPVSRVGIGGKGPDVTVTCRHVAFPDRSRTLSLRLESRDAGVVSSSTSADDRAARVLIANHVGISAVRIGKGPLSPEAIEAAIDLASDPEVLRCMDIDTGTGRRGLPTEGDALTVALVVHGWDRQAPGGDRHHAQPPFDVGRVVEGHLGAGRARVRYEVGTVTKVIDSVTGRLVGVLPSWKGSELSRTLYDMGQASGAYRRAIHQRAVLPRSVLGRVEGDVSHATFVRGPLQGGGEFFEWTVVSKVVDEARKLADLALFEGTASFVARDGTSVTGPTVTSWAGANHVTFRCVPPDGMRIDVVLAPRRARVAAAGGFVDEEARDQGRAATVLMPLDVLCLHPHERWQAVVEALLG